MKVSKKYLRTVVQEEVKHFLNEQTIDIANEGIAIGGRDAVAIIEFVKKTRKVANQFQKKLNEINKNATSSNEAIRVGFSKGDPNDPNAAAVWPIINKFKLALQIKSIKNSIIELLSSTTGEYYNEPERINIEIIQEIIKFPHPQFDGQWRRVDPLVSALRNLKKMNKGENQFFIHKS